jgi:hypothetical protein
MSKEFKESGLEWNTAGYLTFNTEPVLNDDKDIIGYKPKEGKEEHVAKLRKSLIKTQLERGYTRTARTISWDWSPESEISGLPQVHSTFSYWDYFEQVTQEEINEVIKEIFFHPFCNARVVTVRFGVQSVKDGYPDAYEQYKLYRD